MGTGRFEQITRSGNFRGRLGKEIEEKNIDLFFSLSYFLHPKKKKIVEGRLENVCF